MAVMQVPLARSILLFLALESSIWAQDATKALVDQYCIACHSAAIASGGLALDRLDASDPTSAAAEWEAVVRKLDHRQMPPIGMPRPDRATYRVVIHELTEALDSHAAKHPNPGRGATFRRLNRAEYRNAIRDLLALDVDVSSVLPRDESSQGFDNITVGELSPTLLERYLAAARKISRVAVGVPGLSPGGALTILPTDLTQEDRLDGLPFGTRGGAIVEHSFPFDAEYDIRITLSRDRNELVEGLNDPHQVELSLDGEPIERFTVVRPEGRDHGDVDKHLLVRTRIKAGPREISATFLRKSAALIETSRQPHLARFNTARHPRIQPAVYSVSIVGPYNVAGPGETPSRERIFSCHPSQGDDEDACARRILSQLLRRAYRRPISESELAQPLEFYRQGSKEGGFENGVATALRALLVSPEFLFRIERDRPLGNAYEVSDVELASRLSFFLWSSIPDDELISIAERGELRSQLEPQVQRMLGDPRSRALIDNFAGQWLYLRNLDSLTPDRRLFPDFDENLRRSFRRETELLFETIVEEDRSIVELLSADYTFLNERLAKHYGIPHIYGDRFRRVELAEGSHRGGLLSHGSILAVTSYANRTSPVIRGKWILTNILGTPPPPPPPNVPPLEEKVAPGKKLSLRDRMVEHRSNPVCASCHNTLDPVGFALENYDAVGRWRTQDGGVQVDASGVLPDGTAFDGPNEFRNTLLRRPELFVTTAVEKLTTYALGRGLDHNDAPIVRQIVRDAAAGVPPDHYRFSSLVLGVVRSTPFQMRNPR